MAKERFKAGDKVVPRDPDIWVQGNKIWIVKKVSTQDVYVYCKVNGELVNTSFKRKELQHLYKKDGQMVFTFFEVDYVYLIFKMNQNTCPTARLSF